MCILSLKHANVSFVTAFQLKECLLTLTQVDHYKLQPDIGEIFFEDGMAVCSHPALGENFLEKLQAVGLNSVPNWLKPLHCLSTGQQQRVLSAIRASAESLGILYDDFCSYVDQQTLRLAVLIEFKKFTSLWNLLVSRFHGH